MIVDKFVIDDFNSHFNELVNLNKLRQKKSNSKTLGEDFQTNVSKVLFYQFLKVNKTLEQAMIHQLYDCSVDFNSILKKSIFGQIPNYESYRISLKKKQFYPSFSYKIDHIKNKFYAKRTNVLYLKIFLILDL